MMNASSKKTTKTAGGIVVILAVVVLFSWITTVSSAFVLPTTSSSPTLRRISSTRNSRMYATSSDDFSAPTTSDDEGEQKKKKKKVVIIGAGWGGLSAAHALNKENENNDNIEITIVDAAPRVGGLVRDGYPTLSGKRSIAEAGQHGFWDNYVNIFRLLKEEIPNLELEDVLTGYAEQGQYSPRGLEAVWPIYRDQSIKLPTGIAQAAYTRFFNLPLLDRITAFPLVLAFSEFDNKSKESWERYDSISFRDLCIKLGVSRKCYEEAFEPMILTGLFAPGAECSAAAALGMAYFFVLQSQTAFDVRWCRGNIGERILDPWVEHMKKSNGNDGDGVKFQMSSRVCGFEMDDNRITKVRCQQQQAGDNNVQTTIELEADEVIFAVGAKALNTFVRYSKELSQYEEFRRFANLRGTSVLATRIFLDKKIKVPYSANACWGFDDGVGMTVFDIQELHGKKNDNDDKLSDDASDEEGSVLEVDYYHANKLLVMSDEEIVKKVKRDLDLMFPDYDSKMAKVVDAAVVRLPEAVNWYAPGSYHSMPQSAKSSSLDNVYFAGDIVSTEHGSWSQEKAFVTGKEAANSILGRPLQDGILPVPADEPHVAFGKTLVSTAKQILSGGGRGGRNKGPSFVDFLY
uniref:Amine oxidase domain-containing protein n=1 Tax=Grammatophora oceanica TaxID=210454 RepID=A0A7S1YJU9_9STRA|mmetsp:Transcript_6617/g.9685  ORF Transcript_6617/g.9685 Transcript_6617/m.9685 type:complete len:631 (+) Transcript_6617:102-1994(+)